MTRSELHRRVWQTPLSRLAPELGLSDNGLRKLCHRYQIEVPPRGFWARLAAGQKVTRPDLDSPGDDPDIRLPGADDIERKGARARGAAAAKAATVAVPPTIVDAPALRPTLQGCHPLIAGTRRFFEEAVRSDARREKARARTALRFEPNFAALMGATRTVNGRYAPNKPGCLRVVATPRHIDWILRYHDALFRLLQSSGCTIREVTWNQSQRVEIQGHDHQLELSFAEEFDTRKPSGPNPSWKPSEYVPRDSFKLKITRSVGSQKVWAGDQQRLEVLLPTIVTDIVTMLVEGAAVRRVREAEQAAKAAADAQREAERQAAYAAQKRIYDRRVAAKAQLERAAGTARALDEFFAVQRLLASLREQVAGNAALGAWIEVVERSLVDPRVALVNAIAAETEKDMPLWWPVGPQ